MPYIKTKDRIRVIDELLIDPANAGELNFILTTVCDHYLKIQGLNYQHINDCIGALEGAKLELYRRIAAPYEDKKIAENGDVY